MILLHALICSFLIQTSFCIDGTDGDGEYKSYNNYKIYKIEGTTRALELMLFSIKDYDVPYFESRKTSFHILVSPSLVPLVEALAKSLRLSATVALDDFSEIIRKEKVNTQKSNGFSWTAYHDVDVIYGYLQNMSQQHSDWAQLVVGGQSYEGRQILGLKINTPAEKRYREKPIMFIESGIHAREWITPATTTYFINELLTSTDPDIAMLRDQFEWHIFPTVNPDGYHYSLTRDRMWRKTRSKSSNGCYGADPNRNWDYNWLDYGASSRPCDYQVYAGATPFSEVETRTLSEYISGLENMLGYVAFHADAQMLLLPFSDSTEHVDNYDDLKYIGESSLRYGYAVNQEKYEGPGTAAEVLYKASGGSMDWVRHARGTPLVYTFELRGRYFHWPPSRIHEQGDEVTQMMVGLAKGAQELGYV